MYLKDSKNPPLKLFLQIINVKIIIDPPQRLNSLKTAAKSLLKYVKRNNYEKENYFYIFNSQKQFSHAYCNVMLSYKPSDFP